VLRVDNRRALPSLPTKSALEPAAPEIRYDFSSTVPLIARDSFVAETASKLEQLQATVRLLSRDLGQLTGKVGELKDVADQEHRWHAYRQGEKRSKEAKLDEVLRSCRDLKARLDKIEARNGGNYHAYNSFEAVSRKLAELEEFKAETLRVAHNMMLRAWAFCGALSLAVVIIALSNYFAR
jgi:hypothetical protein